MAKDTAVVAQAAALQTVATLLAGDENVIIRVINGVPTFLAVPPAAAAQLTNSQLPAAAAPPVSTNYPIGTWLLNSSGLSGAPWAWSLTATGWSALASIGAPVVAAPLTYSVAILAPVAGTTISGIVAVPVQCGTGMVAVQLRDGSGSGPLLAGATLVNHTATLTFDSSQLAVGTHTLVALAYDAQPDASGLFSTALHNASATLSVTVAGSVTAPVPSPLPSSSPTPAPTTAPNNGFTPASVTEVQVWYELDDATKEVHAGSPSLESQLTDKTAGAHNATQSTGANKPTYAATGLNGKPCIQFDGTGAKVMSIPAASAINNIWAGGGTIIAVINPNADGGSSGFGHLLDKVNWWVEFNGFAVFAFVTVWGGNIYYWHVSPSTQFQFGTPCILRIDYNSDSIANLPTISFNGVPHSLFNTNQPPSGTIDSDASNALLIGNSVGAANPYHGDLAALVIAPTQPSSANGSSLVTYFANDWTIANAGGGVAPAPTPPASPTSPTTAYDLATGSTPSVTVMQGVGYSCIADYTFGSSAGTVKTVLANGHTDDLWTYCQSAYIYSNYGITRLNDEWEFFQRVTAANQVSIDGGLDATKQTHVMSTDHLKLRAGIYSTSLFNAQVARCRASSVAVSGSNPDGHDWGSWQTGSEGGAGYDCGVRSGMLTFLRQQKYGYFECKMQIPDSTKGGGWPAFWCLDGSLGGWPPEVDVEEVAINNAPDNSFNSFHGKQATNAINQQTTITTQLDQFGSYHSGFDEGLAPHIYATEWTAGGDARGDRWKIFVDQVLVWDGYYPWLSAVTGLPSGPAVWMVDMAFGGNWPGRAGACSDITVFPVDIKLYWFRMFTK